MRKKMGQISGYYPDASLINQPSLCARTVDNTTDDGNAIWHLEKEIQFSPKWSQSGLFKYLIKVNEVILLFSVMLMIWVLISNVIGVYLFSHVFKSSLMWWSWSDWQQQDFASIRIFSGSSPILKIVADTCRKFPFFSLSLAWIYNHNKIYGL